MTTTSNKTAGEKIETLARVTDSGTALARNMGWETSYVRFTLDDGREVVWHSENSEKCRQALKVGAEVALSGFLHGNHLRRVQVSKGWMIFGMGE